MSKHFFKKALIYFPVHANLSPQLKPKLFFIMNVEIEKASVSMTSEEACLIFCAMKRSIELSIKSHWRYHPDLYISHNAIAFNCMKQLSRIFHSGAAFEPAMAELNAFFDSEVKRTAA